jgi:hypothetical protein
MPVVKNRVVFKHLFERREAATQHIFSHSIGFSGRPMSLRCGGLLKA